MSITPTFCVGFDKFKLSGGVKKQQGKKKVPEEENGDGFNWQKWLQKALDPEHRWTWISVGAAVVISYLLTRSTATHPEISWQEFRIKYLEAGEVGDLR